MLLLIWAGWRGTGRMPRGSQVPGGARTGEGMPVLGFQALQAGMPAAPGGGMPGWREEQKAGVPAAPEGFQST